MNKKRIGIVAMICVIVCAAIFIPKLGENDFSTANKSNNKISQKDEHPPVELKESNLDKNTYSEERCDAKEKYNDEWNNGIKESLVSKREEESKETDKSKITSNSDMNKSVSSKKVVLENKKDDTNVKEGKKSSRENLVNEEKSQSNKDKTIENSKNEYHNFKLIVGKEQKGYVGKEATVLESKEINIEEGKSAMSYLKDNIENVEDRGGFINKILGIESKYPIPNSELTEEQKEKGILGIDWFIYLNGEKTNVGANDIYPKEGDILIFDYHQWDKSEFKQ